MARSNPPCCIRTVEKWYRSFLAVRGGHHSEVMTQYFLEANRDLAPLFADVLGGVEFRVAASKSVGQALMQPLACTACGSHVALVVLGSPFMLLLFRLQVIFHSMIDSWEVIREGSQQYRERIKWHEPGDFQLRQLRLALEMYLGEKDISHEGMHDLLAPLDQGSPESKRVFLESMRVAESWGVAHEFFHVCAGSYAHETFPQFSPLVNTFQDALKFAAEFCHQVCAVNGLQPDVGRNWLEEFQADLMACKMLLIGIADRRHGAMRTFKVKRKDARFQAARIVLNGVAAAFEAIYWVDVQQASPNTPEVVLSSSHPPNHLRWTLIAAYMKAIAGLQDDVLSNTEVLATLSQRLTAAYESAMERPDSLIGNDNP